MLDSRWASQARHKLGSPSFTPASRSVVWMLDAEIRVIRVIRGCIKFRRQNAE